MSGKSLDYIVFGNDIKTSTFIFWQYSSIFLIDQCTQLFNGCIKCHHRKRFLHNLLYLLRPDLNIFIDVPIDVCVQRLNRGRNLTELYEDEENLNNVRKKYFEAFDKLKDKEKVLIIDGNRPSELIAKDVWETVSKITQLEKSIR